MTGKKVIVALDGISTEKALKIAKTLKNEVWGFKVNDLLYQDIFIIKKLKKFGRVFADVKVHDIPNTVRNTIRQLSKLKVDFITVYAEGGIKMMKVAMKNAGRSKIIGVTSLTSNKDASNVSKLVRGALKGKIDGIVCSGFELKTISKIKGSKRLIKVVPGIRPNLYKKLDDQIRKITPSEAIKLGADYLVIGRPITKSRNPLKVLKELMG